MHGLKRKLARFHVRFFMRAVDFWRIKWGTQSFLVLLSGVIGVAAALLAALLHYIVKMLENVPELVREYPYSSGIVFLLPLGGIAASHYVQRRWGGVFYAKSLSPLILQLHRKKTSIALRESVTHILSSGLSVGLGGSAGLEAPSVLTGAAVGANAAAVCRIDRRQRSLLLGCGSAAAIAAIFGSPIGGVLFAAEVLLAEFSVGALIPMMISSAVAAVFTRMLIGESLLFFDIRNSWQPNAIVFYFILGIICAFVGIFMIRSSYYLSSKLKKGIPDRLMRLLAGGLILCVMLALLPPLHGQGYAYIKLLFAGDTAAMVAELPFSGYLPSSIWTFVVMGLAVILLKTAATIFTIESGGDGGIFAPSMLVGAFVGFVFARLVNMTGVIELQEPNFIATGMCGVFTAVLRAPMTGIFLIADVTGGHTILVPLMLVSALAFFVARRFEPHSIYLKALADNNLLDSDRDKTLLRRLLVKSNLETRYHALHKGDRFAAVVGLLTRTNEDVFPVLDDSGRLIGIVKMEKIREVMLNNELYECLLVFDVMESPEAVLSTEDDLATAMAAFDRCSEAGSVLPVEGRDGVFRGFIDKSSLFNKYRRMVREAESF